MILFAPAAERVRMNRHAASAMATNRRLFDEWKVCYKPLL